MNLSEDDRIVLRVLRRGPGMIHVHKLHLIEAGLIEHHHGPDYKITRAGTEAHKALPKDLQ